MVVLETTGVAVVLDTTGATVVVEGGEVTVLSVVTGMVL